MAMAIVLGRGDEGCAGGIGVDDNDNDEDDDDDTDSSPKWAKYSDSPTRPPQQ